MGFWAAKTTLFRSTVIVAIALVTVPKARAESKGLPCPCDGPQCVPVTGCRRLFEAIANGDVRYVACPAGGKECCCRSSVTLRRPIAVENIADFLLRSAKQSSPSDNVIASEPSKIDKLLKNAAPNPNVNSLYIKDVTEVHQMIESETDDFTTSGNDNDTIGDTPEEEGFAFESFESTTPAPALDQTSDSGDEPASRSSKPPRWEMSDLRIVGGSYDPLRNDNWTVHITTYDYAKRSAYQCTGSLISARHVLTAAHCIYDYLGNRRKLIKLSFGLVDKNKNRPRFVLEDDLTFIEHPNFRMHTRVMDDIAVIRTGRSVPTNGVMKAIRLIPAHYTKSNLAGVWVRVTGWGGTYPLGASDFLLQTDMQIRNMSCTQNSRNIDPQSHLCLVGVNMSDICDGDSGAPATVYLRGQVYVLGVISAGSINCSGSRPAVALFVGYYRHWIERMIAEVEPDYLNYVQFA